jgi:hypothetical protein
VTVVVRYGKNEVNIVQQQIGSQKQLTKKQLHAVQQQIGSQIDEHGRHTPGKLETVVDRLEKAKRS